MLKQQIEHEKFMRQAIELAKKAEALQEVPVGAIVVSEGKIIGSGYNQTISLCDPSAHAEMLAIRQAAKTIKNYRILDASLYVTLEPCSMCAGLLVQSRIKNVVFGAFDQKAGAAGSVLNVTQCEPLNHQLNVLGGVLERECANLLSEFFKARRKAKKILKANAIKS